MKKIELLCLLFFSACTATSPQSTLRWSGQGEKPDLTAFEAQLNSEKAQTSAGEEIQIHQQIVSDFRIESSFVKSVRKKDKGMVFQSAVLTKKIAPLKILQAIRLNQKKERLWSLFSQNHLYFAKDKPIAPLEVIFVTAPEVQPVLYVLTETPSKTLRALYINESGNLILDRTVGSSLSDMIESPSFAFTLGPKKSPLSPIMVNRKPQPEGLSNFMIDVSSHSPAKITLAGTLEFPTSDERFDEIQAFYYSHQIMQWFKQKFGLTNLSQLHIITHLGFPEKTNAAFYFQNQIRLGSGDNITYSNIAWDPTIVMHETSHAVIDAIAHLPYQDQGGSLNEAYADLFTTFYLDSPLLGENSYLLGPFKRSVDQNLKLSDKNGGLYHDSAIVSGFFWSLKKQIGAESTLNLAIHVLNRLGPNSDFADFILSLREQSTELFSGEDLQKINNLMKERELL